MGRRALVTGGAGFVGQWLGRALLTRGYAVTSVSQTARPALDVLATVERDAIRWLADDIRHGERLRTALAEDRPDVIFHLAAVSYVPAAQDSPLLAYDVNVLGFARLLAHVRSLRTAGSFDPVIVVVGSGEQYGRHDAAELPLAEDAVQRPLTVYAATKAAQETIALQAARGEGMRIIATRSFNHSGAGHAPNFLLPALVRRAAQLPATGGSLPLGNDFVTRDFLHVADVAEAYCLLAERGEAGEAYNVASGEGVTVRALAERVLQRLGVSAEIVTDPALVRPVDVPALVGSPAKLSAATGWRASQTRDAIIDDLIRTAGSVHAAS
ncbi:MAG: GDP-mannose 4,6-dehydratase [Gemmatimonadaceae bacterium]|nr:GDP-mannose 4,6-dehydratase [Gemmatimonadaceae bacterium]